MIFSFSKFQIFLLVLLGVVKSDPPRQPTPTPTIQINFDTIKDISYKLEPGELLRISFNPEKYDIQSIQVQEKLANGTLVDRTTNNFPYLMMLSKFNLGGCTSYQSQADYKKLFTVRVNLSNDADNVQARFADVLYYKQNKTFLMVSTDFNFFSYSYVSLGEIQQLNTDDLHSFANFKELVSIKQDQEPWVKGVIFENRNDKNTGYIFTPDKAYRLKSFQVSDIKTDMVLLNSYKSRDKIHSVVTYEDNSINYIFTASGIDGVDIYQINGDLSLSFVATLTKQSSDRVYGIVEKIPQDCIFNIVKIRTVDQGQSKIFILQENNQGLHILLLNKPSLINDPIIFQYQYFIGIPFISSFDAHRYSMSITLGTKTYQSGLEIFFDKNNYYTNYFGDDEIQVDDVVLDQNSLNAIWIGDDIGKAYRHSIFRQNYQFQENIYEEFIDLTGDNHIIFFQHEFYNLVFALGQRRLEVFNVTNVVSQVLCSTNEGGVNKSYNVTFTTNYCPDEQAAEGKEQDALFLFKKCSVSLNLNFQTIDVAVTSANIGLIVGLTIGLFVLLVGILLFVYNRYKKNKGEINTLNDEKKKYMNIESDEHNNMRQNDQNNHIQHQFDIQ